MTAPKEEAAEPVAWARQRSLERLEEHGMIIAISGPGPDGGYTEPLYSQAYVLSLIAEVERLKADRLYIVGCNDGYDAAMEQAAEFCDGAEASWRETADKAHELDHNEAMGWSTTATAKAETCAGLASTIRTATTIPLIRGVGLCLLDGKDAEASAAPPQPSGEVERMREALEPFAKLGALFLDPDNQATKGDDRPVWGYNSIDLTYGDFRRAFAALTGGESND